MTMQISVQSAPTSAFMQDSFNDFLPIIAQNMPVPKPAAIEQLKQKVLQTKTTVQEYKTHFPTTQTSLNNLKNGFPGHASKLESLRL
jgi:hypothetical protein